MSKPADTLPVEAREEIGEMKLRKGKTYDISVTVGTLPTMKMRSPGVTAMGAGGVRGYEENRREGRAGKGYQVGQGG